MDWIRAKDVCSEYPISKSKAYDLIHQFRAESRDWIKDGRIVIIRKSSFEEWWKRHGTRKG